MSKPLVGLAPAILAAACTLVYIAGDHNTVTDTGGHGGIRLRGVKLAHLPFKDQCRSCTNQQRGTKVKPGR